MTTPKPIDFSKVEVLRGRLGLSTSDVAIAMDVTRMTYYHWVRGGNMRESHARRVRAVIRVMLDLLKDRRWFEQVLPAGPEARRKRLLALVR